VGEDFLIWNAVLNAATSFMRLAGHAGLAVSHADADGSSFARACCRTARWSIENAFGKGRVVVVLRSSDVRDQLIEYVIVRK
jgi:hypothetical protein